MDSGLDSKKQALAVEIEPLKSGLYLSENPGESYEIKEDGRKLAVYRMGVDFKVSEDIPESLEKWSGVVAGYDWVTGEKFSCVPWARKAIDMLVDSGSTYAECCELVRQGWRVSLTPSDLRSYINSNEHAKSYYESKVESKAVREGLTFDKYIVLLKQIYTGEVKKSADQIQVLKHIGKVMGWEGDRPTFNQNLQINIRQADGKE